MIRTVIIDDEYYIRVQVKSCIDWEELGYQIVGEAEDGEEALRLIDVSHPGLAIVDINMPQINGLRFAKLAKEKDPDLNIIVLTGYSDFNYAREAISIRVFSYLLKPVNKDELKETLLQLKLKIERETEVAKYIGNLKESLSERSTQMKEKLWHDLLENRHGFWNERQRAEVETQFPNLPDGNLTVLAVSIHQPADMPVFAAESDGEHRRWLYSVRNVLHDTLRQFFMCETYFDVNQTIVSVLRIAENGTITAQPLLETACRTAQEMVKNQFHLVMAIGMGGIQKGMAGIHQSYREALMALNEKLVAGYDRLIVYESLDVSAHPTPDFTPLGNELLIYLRLGNIQEIDQRLDKALQRCNSVADCNILLTKFAMATHDFAHERHLDLIKIFGEAIDPYRLTKRFESLAELRQWIVNGCAELIKTATGLNSRGHSGLVEKIKAYIDQNFTDQNLNLDSISSAVFSSPPYISSVFKKETGFLISDYITQKRMEKAKQLILEKRLNLQEIVDMIGYSDPYYFSKCFKKYFGVSPLKYSK